MKKEQIVLTGVKPTGVLHLGNFVGAMKPVIELSKGAAGSYIFIADLHALNAIRDPENLKKYTIELAAAYLALGVDTERTAFFRQSDVPEVAELSTLLMNITPKGLMNRAHSYKDAAAKNEAAGDDIDSGVNMGLYTYPILMAADILLYNTDLVPVGKDQKQHLEFARDIAGFFNNAYGETFKLPDGFIREDAGIIPGLDGRKMSKSYGNQIPLFDSEKELEKKIMKITTDSKLPDEPKNPDDSTIFLLYKHFASEREIAEMKERFLGGKIGYGDAKKMLFRAVSDHMEEPREKYNKLLENPDAILDVLKSGAERARPVAKETVARVRKRMGL